MEELLVVLAGAGCACRARHPHVRAPSVEAGGEGLWWGANREVPVVLRGTVHACWK